MARTHAGDGRIGLKGLRPDRWLLGVIRGVAHGDILTM
jgi:hypothetical protein